jgi:Predicted integral membrane zinc-ribbon metal-binding protein
LGEEDGLSGGTSGASSKYALICKKCFTHNGLVMERDFETTREFQGIFFTA